ncbi:MAG: hypothetical protein HYV63_32870 [Candidatus Schekmanbacteria bacterium]|nr:hypothetical protein [Candidatus Schekmanbacteria bacterium]
MLGVISGTSGADKTVRLEAEYETAAGGTLSLEFDGPPSDAQPLKDFLEPQFRAAQETHLTCVYTVSWNQGFPLAGDEPEKLSARLTRFATGAAFVEAEAEAEAK